MKNKLLLFYCFVFFSFSYGQNSITSLKKLLEEETVDSLKVSLKVDISNSFSVDQKDSVIYYYNKALVLADSISYKPRLAFLLKEKGHEFAVDNNYELAIVNYQRSLNIFKNLQDYENIAVLYNIIGYAYINLYSEEKAIEYYLKSLKLYQQLNDNDGIAMNFNDIGNLYSARGNYGAATKYFLDALKIYEDLDDNDGVSGTYTNLGNVYTEQGSYNKAIAYYRESIVLETSLNDFNGIAINYNNLGDLNIRLGDFKQAKTYFFKSLEIANEINDQELIASIYLNLSDVYRHLNDYNKSMFYASKSYEISKKYGILNVQLKDLEYLAEAYERIGNVKKALFYHKKHDVIKDSLLNYDKHKIVQLFNALNKLDQNNYTISELSTKTKIAELNYQNEKKISYYLIIAIVVFAFLVVLLIHQQTAKKKAFNLLEFRNFQINRMNSEIQEQRDYLNQLNKTKDKFFSIIAHDLKNPFNSIKGFTELLIDNRSEYSEEKQLKFLKIIKSSVSTASALLDNLLIWAHSQSGTLTYSPKKISLVSQVMSTVSLLEIQAVRKEISIFNAVDHNLFVTADENMLNTILRNLISNAIKFTKSEGEIKIVSCVKEGMAQVSIKDDGIGISKEDIDTIFNVEDKKRRVGTANEQGSGLGLILCKDFIEKHGGRLWVLSTLGEGAEFIFTLPLWEEEEVSVFKL